MTPVLYLLCATTIAAGWWLAHVCADLRRGWATPLLRVWWRR